MEKIYSFVHLFKTYWVAALVTILIWGVVAAVGGFDALTVVMILTLLELTFSFDNAVVNSRVLATLSHIWRTLFLTVGIILAVFVVRFCLPIFIVGVSADLGFGEVVDMALQHPKEYAHALEQATPIIEAFGGTFLLLVGASYFIDTNKKTHWLRPIERRLAWLGKLSYSAIIVMLAMTAIIYLTITHQREAILIAGVVAIGLQFVMSLLDTLMSKHANSTAGHKTGIAALVGFLYLQVLDASFSLDGVIGAFAITTSVLLIMAGLGAGAVWVRAMTIHLVETGALARYRYLEHGAHWAILALGAIMILKLYDIEPADWATGAIGLTLIVLSMIASRKT